MNILDKIIKHKETEVELFKKEYKFLYDLTLNSKNEFSLINNIEKSKNINVISEIKKGSPSKGLFAEHLNVKEKAKEYELNGASCISVLTDENFFYGSFEILDQVRESVSVPILCKDFIIDEIQIKLAKYHGANVILLIKRVLDIEHFKRLLKSAKEHKLEVLVEVDSLDEFNQIKDFDFKLCGVNNRDLSDFSIDLNKTKVLSQHIKGSNKYLISESGIDSKEQVLELRNYSIDGLLVGESLVKSTSTSLINDLQILKKRTEVKICGIKDLSTALHVEKSGADYIGFVFAESKRRISKELAKEIITSLNTIKTVGVFLNESASKINDIFNECNLDFVQIHGTTNLSELSMNNSQIIIAKSFD